MESLGVGISSNLCRDTGFRTLPTLLLTPPRGWLFSPEVQNQGIVCLSKAHGDHRERIQEAVTLSKQIHEPKHLQLPHEVTPSHVRVCVWGKWNTNKRDDFFSTALKKIGIKQYDLCSFTFRSPAQPPGFWEGGQLPAIKLLGEQPEMNLKALRAVAEQPSPFSWNWLARSPDCPYRKPEKPEICYGNCTSFLCVVLKYPDPLTFLLIHIKCVTFPPLHVEKCIKTHVGKEISCLPVLSFFS